MKFFVVYLGTSFEKKVQEVNMRSCYFFMIFNILIFECFCNEVVKCCFEGMFFVIEKFLECDVAESNNFRNK